MWALAQIYQALKPRNQAPAALQGHKLKTFTFSYILFIRFTNAFTFYSITQLLNLSLVPQELGKNLVTEYNRLNNRVTVLKKILTSILDRILIVFPLVVLLSSNFYIVFDNLFEFEHGHSVIDVRNPHFIQYNSQDITLQSKILIK